MISFFMDEIIDSSNSLVQHTKEFQTEPRTEVFSLHIKSKRQQLTGFNTDSRFPSY